MFDAEKFMQKTDIQKAFLVGLKIGGMSATQAGHFLPILQATHNDVIKQEKANYFFLLFLIIIRSLKKLGNLKRNQEGNQKHDVQKSAQ